MTSLDKWVVNRAAHVPSGLRQWEVTPSPALRLTTLEPSVEMAAPWDGGMPVTYTGWVMREEINLCYIKPLRHWSSFVFNLALSWQICHVNLEAMPSAAVSREKPGNQSAEKQRQKQNTKKGELGKVWRLHRTKRDSRQLPGFRAVFQFPPPGLCALAFSVPFNTVLIFHINQFKWVSVTQQTTELW